MSQDLSIEGTLVCHAKCVTGTYRIEGSLNNGNTYYDMGPKYWWFFTVLHLLCHGTFVLRILCRATPSMTRDIDIEDSTTCHTYYDTGPHSICGLIGITPAA